jgi:hypothetical protein
VQHGQQPATIDALVAAHRAHLAATGRRPSTIRRYEQLWHTWLASALGDRGPSELHHSDVERALAAMADAGQSDRSIHQAAVVLNTAYAWARDQGLAPRNPVVGSELPDGRTVSGTRRR